MNLKKAYRKPLLSSRKDYFTILLKNGYTPGNFNYDWYKILRKDPETRVHIRFEGAYISLHIDVTINHLHNVKWNNKISYFLGEEYRKVKLGLKKFL